jgi:sulfatase maturation enzyme AslB (radical SAM superfamily)
MDFVPPAGGAAGLAPGDLVPVPGPDPAALYRAARDGYDLFYAPGCVCVVPTRAAAAFAAGLARPGTQAGRWAAELQRRAARAAGSGTAEQPFRPECLTLYLHNECNLGCTYCYAAPGLPASSGRAGAEHGGRLDPKAVAAAADLVAANCQAAGQRLTAVFHGGGEPSLYPQEVDELLDLVAGVARRWQVELFRYVATNGVLPADRAAWLARRFDLVGLSCDGPAAIHDAQRPAAAGRDGRGTLAAVQRTARVLRAAGARFQVRATITPAGLGRQPEIAAYICQHLTPAEIHFEPVYGGGRSGPGAVLEDGDAPAFVAGLLAARAVAAGHGVPLSTSLCRPATRHGAYCHVFRQVLNLLPPGAAGGPPCLATACFKDSTAEESLRRGTAIGAFDSATGQFAVHEVRLAALRARLAALPPGCAACFNRWHCTHGCPDACLLDGGGPQAAPFRCQASRSLAAALLAEAAERLWATVRAGEAEAPHGCLLSS